MANERQIAALQATLKLDTTQFSKSLTTVKNNMLSFQKFVTDSNRKIKTSFTNLGNSIKTYGKDISTSMKATNTSYKETLASVRMLSKATQTSSKEIKSSFDSIGVTLKQLKNTTGNSFKVINSNLSQTQKLAAATAKSLKQVTTGKSQGSINTSQNANKAATIQPKKLPTPEINAPKNSKAVISEVNKVSDSFLNLKNITKGILISQTLYSGISAIQSMTTGMFDMARAVEDTESSFATMLGDAQLAKELATYVQDYANSSAFSFQTATNASKQLLAYGFDIKNLGYLLETIGDASAAMGDAEAFGRIAKALGQIQTKGKVATQEIC